MLTPRPRVSRYRFCNRGVRESFVVAAIGMTQSRPPVERRGHAATVAALWAFNGWWLGRRFEKEKEKTGSAA